MRKQLLAPDENHHKVRIEDDALIAAVNLSHLAICGVDIDLSWLGDSLNARHHYPSSFGMLLTHMWPAARKYDPALELLPLRSPHQMMKTR